MIHNVSLSQVVKNSRRELNPKSRTAQRLATESHYEMPALIYQDMIIVY